MKCLAKISRGMKKTQLPPMTYHKRKEDFGNKKEVVVDF